MDYITTRLMHVLSTLRGTRATLPACCTTLVFATFVSVTSRESGTKLRVYPLSFAGVGAQRYLRLEWSVSQRSTPAVFIFMRHPQPRGDAAAALQMCMYIVKASTDYVASMYIPSCVICPDATNAIQIRVRIRTPIRVEPSHIHLFDQ